MKLPSLLLPTCLSAALLLGAWALDQPFSEEWYRDILRQLNIKRAYHGFPNLCMSRKLNLTAQTLAEAHANSRPDSLEIDRILNNYGFNHNRTLQQGLIIERARDWSREPVARPIYQRFWPEILNPCSTHIAFGKAQKSSNPNELYFHLVLATNPNPNQDCDYTFPTAIKKHRDFSHYELETIESHANNTHGGSKVILSEGAVTCAPLPPISPSFPLKTHTPKNIPTYLPESKTPHLSYSEESYQNALSVFNKARASYGLPNVCISKELNFIAQKVIEDYASPKYSRLGHILDKVQKQYHSNFDHTFAYVTCFSSFGTTSRKAIGEIAYESVWPDILNPCISHFGFTEAPNLDPSEWCVLFVFSGIPNPNQGCDYISNTPINKTNDFTPGQLETIEKNGEKMGYGVLISGRNIRCAPVPITPPSSLTPKVIPTPTPQRVPTPPPTTPDLPTSRRLTAKDLFEGPGNQTAASQKDPNPIQTALSTYNNNTTVGVQSAFDQLKLTLSSPYLILFLGTVLAATTLVWYFRGAIYGFFKGIYDSALGWFNGKSKKVQKDLPISVPGAASSSRPPPIGHATFEEYNVSDLPSTSPPKLRDSKESKPPISPRKIRPPKNLEEMGKLILDPINGQNVKMLIQAFTLLGDCQKDSVGDLKTVPEKEKIERTRQGWELVCKPCKNRFRKNFNSVCETLNL